MTSVRQGILEEIRTILTGGTKPVGVPDARVRRPIPEGPIMGPEINIYYGAEDVEVRGGRHGPLVQRRVRLVIEARDVTGDPEAVDSILDPYLVWISKSLSSSNNLNRKALDLIEAGTVWVPFYSDKIYAVARVSFLVDYQTSRLDPEAVS